MQDRFKTRTVHDFGGAIYDEYPELAAERVPTEGTLELTQLCSLKCEHCYIGDGRFVKNPNELSTQEIKEALDALAEAGMLWLTFTGGEAMIRKDFRELWRYAQEKGFLLILFTNATLIDESMGEFLADFPPIKLEVSIYGADAETYEALTQTRGSFPRFLRGIEQIRKHKFPWILKAPLIERTKHQFERLQSLAKDWGTTIHFGSAIKPAVGQHEDGQLAPCSVQLDDHELVALELKDAIRNRDTVANAVEGQKIQPDDSLAYSCGAGKNSFYLTAEGNLQMCVLTAHRGHSIRGGKSIQSEIQSTWQKFGEYRKIELPENSPCRNCDLAFMCSSCAGFSYLENGNEFGAVASLCRQTHLKANMLKIPHRCHISHFVYDTKKTPVVESIPASAEAP